MDAGAKAIAAADLQPGDIDAVLCAAANMQRAYPAMACEIQAALGCGGYGFDMNVACSSATFALQEAVNAVRSGSATRVLIVNPEITSAHLEWRDRDCHFIFGDVCTAIVVEAEDSARSAERWRVRGTRLVTQYSNHIRNNAGFMNRCEDTLRDNARLTPHGVQVRHPGGGLYSTQRKEDDEHTTFGRQPAIRLRGVGLRPAAGGLRRQWG